LAGLILKNSSFQYCVSFDLFESTIQTLNPFSSSKLKIKHPLSNLSILTPLSCLTFEEFNFKNMSFFSDLNKPIASIFRPSNKQSLKKQTQNSPPFILGCVDFSYKCLEMS